MISKKIEQYSLLEQSYPQENSDPSYFQWEIANWLKEIAYQLAVANERNAQESQIEFRLPRPFEGEIK